MKKNLVLLISVLVFSLSLSSCGGAKEQSEAEEKRSDVELAADAYYGLLADGDFKAAVQSTYDYNKEMTEEEKEEMNAMLDMTADKLKEAMNEKE